jgi:hypothetical protein
MEISPMSPTKPISALLAFVALGLSQATVLAQSPRDDSATVNPLKSIVVMRAACPDGRRSDKQQAECKRVIDSIQADRARRLENARVDGAVGISRDLLMDNSFIADDDGRSVPPGRWIHIGSVNGDEQGKRAAIEMNIGRAKDGTLLVGALWTKTQTRVSMALRIDCRHDEALVLKLTTDSAITVESDAGIGPWYPGTRQRAVLQALVHRACG